MKQDSDDCVLTLGLGEVAKLVIRAAFGMQERMTKGLALKTALVKLGGALAGAVFFTVTAAWGIGICSSTAPSEQQLLWRLIGGVIWLAQCTWMGSALAAICWLRSEEDGPRVSEVERILLAVFGVTPKSWVQSRGDISR